MAIRESKRAANDKYTAKCDTIILRPLKPIGERIRQAASDSGKSLQGFILDAINKQINNNYDGEDIPPDIITSLIVWLQAHNISNRDIINCLESLGQSDSIPQNIMQALPNKPQPPADLIATKDRNNIVMWLLDHGWNNAETMQFISDNGL